MSLDDDDQRWLATVGKHFDLPDATRRCGQCKGYGQTQPLVHVGAQTFVQTDDDGNELPPVVCPRCKGSGLDPLRGVP